MTQDNLLDGRDIDRWEAMLRMYNIQYNVSTCNLPENKCLVIEEGDGTAGSTFVLEFNDNGDYVSYGAWM